MYSDTSAARAPTYIRVLAVEDNAGDRDLLREHFECSRNKYRLTFASTLAAAVDAALTDPPQLVLLDLGLPDSTGLDTLVRLRQAIPDTPVVVVTGAEDEDLALEALARGAQDYLPKDALQPELIARTIRYAMERSRLLAELAHKNERTAQDRESQVLATLSAPLSVTAALYGRKPLRESAPAAFCAWVAQYRTLLDVSLEAQVKRSGLNATGGLEELAHQLGTCSAGPRDVVELHRASLAAISPTLHPSKIRPITEEGRYLVLELMGHLVSYYRRRAIPTAVSGPYPDMNTGADQ